MALRDNVRENLRRRLELGDVSVTEIARRSGVHRVTIHKVLAGEFEPSLSLCEALATAVGIEPEKIFLKSRTQSTKSA